MKKNDVQIEELILKRWSPRAFSTKTVEATKLEALFEAARWAPSSRNQQPWRYVYATRDEPEAWQKLFDSLMEGNQEWNKKVPVLIVVVARVNSDSPNKPNRHAFYDTGQSVSALVLQATKMGLYAHQMGGFYPEKVKEAIGIPEGFEPVVIMSLGYLGDKSELSEPFRSSENKPRARNTIGEIVFKGFWNKSPF